MPEIGRIGSYHAHVYYDEATRPAAARLREQLAERFRVQMGRWRDEPVGPHVRAMYQVAFDVAQFATLVPWLMLNRAGLTILVHPNTDRPRDDHVLHALWMGEVLAVKEEVLSETREEAEPVAPNTAPSRAVADGTEPDEPALFEIMRTTRSMRRLRPDPVPDALIRRVLEAGTYAANGGNMQSWRFLLIRDPGVKREVGALYRRAWNEQVGPRYRAGTPAPGMSAERFQRLLAAAEHLAEHIHEAPVWIVPCLQGAAPTRTSGSSVYPAVQNMLLAARALGLGATLTTLYLLFEKEAEAAMGLPPDVHSYAILPIGYPMGRFGPVRRTALADVAYEDRWGRPYRDPSSPPGAQEG